MFPFEASDPKRLYKTTKKVPEYSSDDQFSQNQSLYKHFDGRNSIVYDEQRKKKKMKEYPRMLQQWEIFSEDPDQGVILKQTISCRSLAWIIFRQADDSLNAWCRICGERKRARKGNTTNLLHHIQNQHWQVFCTLQQKIKIRQKYPENVINLCEDVVVKMSDAGIELEHKNKQKSHMPLEIKTIDSKGQVMPRRKKQSEEKDMYQKQIRQNLSQSLFPLLQDAQFDYDDKNQGIHEQSLVQKDIGQPKKKKRQNRQPTSIKKSLPSKNPYQFNSNQNILHPSNEYPEFQENPHNSRKYQIYNSKIQSIQGSPNFLYHNPASQPNFYPAVHQIVNNHCQRQAITKYQESIETIKDRQYLEKLRSDQHLQIIQTYENNQIVSLILINEQMRQNLMQYSETIGFWQIPKPTLLGHIKNSIIICGQNQQIVPVLFGVAILFKQTDENYTTIFNSFYQRYLKIKKKWPLLTITCGTQSFQLLYSKFLSLISSDQRYQFIHLQPCVLFSKNKQLADSILKRTRVSEALFTTQEKASFIGFCLTYSYIDKIINFTPIRTGIQLNLKSFLHKVFELIENQPQCREFLFPQKVNQEFIQKYKCLAECHNHISSQIFQKLLVNFLYSKFSLHLKFDGNQQQCQVFQVNADTPFNYRSMSYEVRYNGNSQKWECKCRLDNWIGIPCPHIIKIVIHKKISLFPYLAQKWLNRTKRQIKAQQNSDPFPYTINNYQRIRKQKVTELPGQQHNYFDLISAQNYLNSLWS